jgi:hypothetical protein
MVGYKQTYAAMVRFDLSAIPADAAVIRATLQLYASGWSGVDQSIGAHVITRIVALSQATWNEAMRGVPWEVAGCNGTVSDRRAAAESYVTTSGIYRWYSFDLSAAAQGWVSGLVPNGGVLLRSAGVATSTFHFFSAESGDVATRPKLVITYRVSS